MDRWAWPAWLPLVSCSPQHQLVTGEKSTSRFDLISSFCNPHRGWLYLTGRNGWIHRILTSERGRLPFPSPQGAKVEVGLPGKAGKRGDLFFFQVALGDHPPKKKSDAGIIPVRKMLGFSKPPPKKKKRCQSSRGTSHFYG